MSVINIYALSDYSIEKKIGERLKSARLRQNISQARLATEAQVSLTTIKKLEKGEIGTFDSFIRVVRTLGKLDILQPLVEDEKMSPNEYYEFVYSLNRKRRKRAAKTKSNNTSNNNDNYVSEW